MKKQVQQWYNIYLHAVCALMSADRHYCGRVTVLFPLFLVILAYYEINNTVSYELFFLL